MSTIFAHLLDPPPRISEHRPIISSPEDVYDLLAPDLSDADRERIVELAIGKLAGVNVLFDPDYQSRQMPALDLNGVTLQQALDMVALESSTFWRPSSA